MPQTKIWYKFVLTLIMTEPWGKSCFHICKMTVLITNLQYRFQDGSGIYIGLENTPRGASSFIYLVFILN